MGSHHLRDDKTCENCGYVVDVAYCSNCGQKNVETRQSFRHLISHFAEDLTHYDAAFWKTIKYLLFRPGRLTLEYLEGKRQTYVPPVKLYIFISFLTFFLPAVMPDGENEFVKIAPEDKNAAPTEVKKPLYHEREKVWVPDFLTDEGGRIDSPIGYTSIKQLDSVEATKPEKLRLSALEYKLAKGTIARYSHNTPEQVREKFKEAYAHNIPKGLFLYMPVFGFWLWLLHGKRRWLFFDHGIFTLHYFSFLLLSITTINIVDALLSYANSDIVDTIIALFACAVFIYMFYYFFRAHRKMYRETRVVNFVKSMSLFFVNLLSMLAAAALLALYTYHNIH